MVSHREATWVVAETAKASHKTQLLGAAGGSDGWQAGPEMQIEKEGQTSQEGEKQGMPDLLEEF